MKGGFLLSNIPESHLPSTNTTPVELMKVLLLYYPLYNTSSIYLSFFMILSCILYLFFLASSSTEFMLIIAEIRLLQYVYNKIYCVNLIQNIINSSVIEQRIVNIITSWKNYIKMRCLINVVNSIYG